MTEPTELDNPILLQLRALGNELASLRSETREGFTSVETRLGRIEVTAGELHSDYAALSVRIDQVVADMRILKTRYETVG